MGFLFLGSVALLVLLYAGGAFSKTDPARAKRLLRPLGGVGALIVAALLLVRGEAALAVPIGVAGLATLGWISLWPPGFGSKWKRSSRVSRVRSAYLEMELDHDSGVMRGRVLDGRYAGTALDALDRATLIGLLGEIDGDSRQLLLAYLDRREPRWREHAQRDTAAGGGGRAAPSGKMTEEEAYQILGLEAGASAQEVGRAHRSLIKKLHPDQGGSTYLAARVNDAKDVLLRRHR